jgi:hypothetical protein
MLRCFANGALRGAELGVRGGPFVRKALCRAGKPVFASRSFASTPVLTPVPESAVSSNEDGGRSKDSWTKRKETWLAPAVLLGAVSVLITVLLAYEKSHRKQVDVALRQLSAAFTVVALDGVYIPRADAERSIRDYIGSAPPSTYLIVTAPKGSGKSTVIHHALAGRVGVLHVQVQNATEVPDVYAITAEALGADLSCIKGSPKNFVTEVCAAFREKHGKPPVIVFSVEGEWAAPLIEQMAKRLGHVQKALSSDLRVAYTIADIAAIAVATGMGNDPRAKFVNIRGLTMDEALLLLEPFAHRLQEKGVLVKEVVEQIGGNPASLMAVGGDSYPRGVMAGMLADAEAEVKAYVDAYPAHKEALRQLLLMPFGDGMLVAVFERIVRAEMKKLKLTGAAATAQSASLSSRVIHKNLQNKHIVVHNFPQYRVGQRLAAAWAEEA